MTEYKIEYDTAIGFDASPATVTRSYLAGGAPFNDIITGLTTGTTYYVRVYAKNSEGFGLYQV